MEKEKFYKLLEEATYDDIALVKVLEQIMPIINKNSLNNNVFDNDLKEVLIEYAIKIIKNKDFVKKLAKN